mmetsp:Transcript_34173/g.71928  ORF Transcript_34173/g.71928 Transcript_34173/m.71928 type:complete len:174 (+) Transcript_34173:117-638(+)
MSLFSRLTVLGSAHQEGQGVGILNGQRGGKLGRSIDNGTATGIPNNQKESTPKGVQLKTLKPGDITNYPKKGDTCTIHYEAFPEDETCTSKGPEPFDSSRSRDQPFQFRLGVGQVIEGMDYAVSKMSVGQEVEATIPYQYAYGVKGYPPVVKPRATLMFRIELVSFSEAPFEK